MGYFTSIYQYDLSHRAVTVYMNLRDKCYYKNQCYPNVETIAGELKLSERTVYRALSELEKAGIIERYARFDQKGHRSSNLYCLKTEF